MIAVSNGRLILTVCLAASTTSVVAAGMSYLIVPLLGDLNLTQDEAINALVIPGIGGLLLVFVAGVLGARFGERRTLGVAASTYFAGALLVAIAPDISLVTLGLLIVSCSGITLSIVSLSLLNSRISEPAQRATAFATLGVVAPAVFIAMPVLSGALTQFASWRWIPVLWAVLAVFVVLATIVFLQPVDRPSKRQEFVSPILAGLFLAAILQVLNNWPAGGLSSVRVWIPLAVACAAFVGFIYARNRVASPSLTLAPLRSRATTPLLIVAVLFPLANVFFYITMGWQYLFGLSPLQTAVILVPLQLACIVGARFIAGPMVKKHGIYRSGLLLFSAYIIATFMLMLISPTAPVWIPMLMTSLWAGTFTGVAVVLSNAIMSSRPVTESGNTSSYQKAASAVSASLSALLVAPLVFITIGNVLEGRIIEEGASPLLASSLTYSIQTSASPAEQSTLYVIELPGDKPLQELHGEALIAGLRVDALTAGGLGVVCLGLFAYARPGYVRDHKADSSKLK